MKEKGKSNRGLIVFLILIILCLAGYIVYNITSNSKRACNAKCDISKSKKKSNSKKTDNDSGELSDKKTIEISIDKNEELDTSSYWYDDEDGSIKNYKIKSNNFEVKINYESDGYTTFNMGDKYDVIYTPDNYILTSIKKHNKYLFITLSCACGVPSTEYTINMEEKEILPTLCVPSDNGTCEGFSYKRTYDNNYIEYFYKINYDTNDYQEEKKGQFNCNDYQKYDTYENSNGIECENNTCERRTKTCFPHAV